MNKILWVYSVSNVLSLDIFEHFSASEEARKFWKNKYEVPVPPWNYNLYVYILE